MSKQPTPKQRRSQRGSVEDRWRKRVKDEDGNTLEVPSAVAGKVTRWRARYVDNAGREHTRTFDRKVAAQKWLDAQLATLLRGDHIAPRDARLTVGEWCDKWLAGYGTRRVSTVRQAEVHIKVIKAYFDAVPMSAVRPSDVRAWTVALKKEGRADSYIYALYSRLSQLFADAVHDGIVARNPCSRRTSPGMGKQRPYVATTKQVWALYDAVPPGVRPAILLGAHAGLRLAEAAALRVTDVDFASGLVTPSVQWVDEPLKSDTARTPIPIPAEMARLLAEAIPLGNGTHRQRPVGRRRRPVDDRTSRTRRPDRRWAAECLPVPRPPALLRVAAHRLGSRREGCPSATPARLGEDHSRHLRPSVAGPRQHIPGRRRGRLPGATMSYFTIDVGIDSFEPDEDGLIRVRLADFDRPVAVGDIVTVCDDELLEFARVERLEGDLGAGIACLTVLKGAEGEWAARVRALDAHWCSEE
jgi:integrase